MRSIGNTPVDQQSPGELLPLPSARPVSSETPKIWAPAALFTPTDDDIFGCRNGHTGDDTYVGTCHDCTDEKTEAIESISLVYYLVLSTFQADDPFTHGSHFNGKLIYKLIKGGSREAVVSEAFYAAGVNGWNVAFGCVTRLDEDFEERRGHVKRVEHLWSLAEEEDDEHVVRVFY